MKSAGSWSGRSRTRAGLLALALGVGVVVSSHVSATPAEAIGIHYNYYDNYFKSAETCKARGKKLMKEVSNYISFACHKKKGNSKWSMNIYYDDGFGCFVLRDEFAGGETPRLEPFCGGRA